MLHIALKMDARCFMPHIPALDTDVVVTQHERCEVAVTVVTKSKSKSNKFKVGTWGV
jgi:hypothetical protein